jgi:hypothetical protein
MLLQSQLPQLPLSQLCPASASHVTPQPTHTPKWQTSVPIVASAATMEALLPALSRVLRLHEAFQPSSKFSNATDGYQAPVMYPDARSNGVLGAAVASLPAWSGRFSSSDTGDAPLAQHTQPEQNSTALCKVRGLGGIGGVDNVCLHNPRTLFSSSKHDLFQSSCD